MYSIELEGDLEYRCYFCCNQQNHEQFEVVAKKKSNLTAAEQVIKKNIDDYLQNLRQLPRDHMFTVRDPIALEHEQKKVSNYMPQVGDMVYYFYQGHEEYVMQYNLHHFSGINSEVNTSKFMPWLSDHKDLLESERFVLCKVTAVETIFPSRRELALIE
jgi:hypothetical protein